VEQVPTLGEYLSLHLAQQPDHQQQQPLQQCLAPSQQQQQSPPSQQQRQASSCAETVDVMTGWRWVPDKVLQRHADVIDVATGASRSCNCFTKVGALRVGGCSVPCFQGALQLCLVRGSQTQQHWLGLFHHTFTVLL
jgi:hypothetical protein